MAPADIYCGRCGAQQREPGTPPPEAAAGPEAPPPGTDIGALDQLSPSTAAILCYIPWVGWIASIVVLATERFRPDKVVRFHAFQGLYLFVLWLFVSWVFGPIAEYANTTRAIGSLMKLGVLAIWIFMIVKTSQRELVKLPLLGELADRSVAEQK